MPLAQRHRRPVPFNRANRLVLVDFNRIPGVSREFLINQVRANKETFSDEVISAGFEFTAEVPEHGFKENYLLRITKPQK